MKGAAHAVLLAGLLLVGAGCASSTRPFDWSVYQDGIARIGESGEGADPAEEARALSEEVERCSDNKVSIPPGVLAHLGWLYLKLGNAAGARQMFESEKAAFPESGVLMDRMIGRMGP